MYAPHPPTPPSFPNTLCLNSGIIGIYNVAGVEVVHYDYNAWGETVNLTFETGYNHIVQINPFRYRGYYFDQETGFYYLNSRYYDPSMYRFINADGLVSTGQGLLGNNMYAYCNNNPVMYADPSGTNADVKEALGAWLVFGQTIAWADGPALIGDAIYALVTIALTVAVVISIPSSEAQSGSDSKEEAPSISVPEDNENQQTFIYRYGSALYPDSQDMFLFNPKILVGVSFSLDPPKNPNRTYYVTTMEILNNSGIFIAINDHGRHVTVMPTGVYGSITTWYYDGRFHPYTFALKSLCTRVN